MLDWRSELPGKLQRYVQQVLLVSLPNWYLHDGKLISMIVLVKTNFEFQIFKRYRSMVDGKALNQ